MVDGGWWMVDNDSVDRLFNLQNFEFFKEIQKDNLYLYTIYFFQFI